VLFADAFLRFMRDFAQRLPKLVSLLPVMLFVFQFTRFFVPVIGMSGVEDNSLHSARWLMQNCPHEKCVAYAENFWNYWPIRFYTRDGLDLNFAHHNWKPVAFYPAQGRTVAGCWYEESWVKYRGPYKYKMVFAASRANPAQVCFYDIVAPVKPYAADH
jgi:hypothetical protein